MLSQEVKASKIDRSAHQLHFPLEIEMQRVAERNSSTFINNMVLPIHRWFRYSAGFSAEWVRRIITENRKENQSVRIFDPFAGSATTLIEAERAEVESSGVDPHPFVARIAKAKLLWRTNPDIYVKHIEKIQNRTCQFEPQLERYPKLISKCYTRESLARLDLLRQSFEANRGEGAESELAWLTLTAILRKVSHAGTAQWQYVLPKKQKSAPTEPFEAFSSTATMFYEDMQTGRFCAGPKARFYREDARECSSIEGNSANLVITSPPYPNNYDYADATRLEMSFWGEVNSWGDLQDHVRKYLICSCSQHVPEKSARLKDILEKTELAPIRTELSAVCEDLAQIREEKGGRKTYHLMIASYFHDMALVWKNLRRICRSPSKVCFVIGDSAPYGIYVPVVPWLEKLAENTGFKFLRFEKTRDRNIKWKNRKHRVPLQEGRFWVEG
jgi:hypothetical protein